MDKAKNAFEIIAKLKQKYKDDPEAVEIIEQAKKDIEYLNAKEQSKDYTGQTALGKAKELEAYLNDWC
jgi:hypothetical protein